MVWVMVLNNSIFVILSFISGSLGGVGHGKLGVELSLIDASPHDPHGDDCQPGESACHSIIQI